MTSSALIFNLSTKVSSKLIQIFSLFSFVISRIGSFETVSPRGLMVDQQVEQSADNSSIYSVDVAWTPTLSQFGLNIFCFAAEAVSR